MRVKALAKTYYNKQDRFPGDEYDVDERELTQLKALEACGIIQILKEEPQKPRGYRTAAVKPQDEPPPPWGEEPKQDNPGQVMTTEGSGLVSGPRRRYLRRDMKAEQ